MSFTVDGVEVEVKKFPAGESHITILSESVFNHYNIEWKFENNSEVFDLMLIVDSLRRQSAPYCDIFLRVPYLPYARQDRVCNPGEALSIKVLCGVINSLKFTGVCVTDSHSDVALTLLDNVIHIPVEEALVTPLSPNTTLLVAPDAGAYKKVHKYALTHGFEQVIVANKVRDTKTGEIKGVSVTIPEEYRFCDILILDDICDGGRTFVELAKAMQPQTQGSIYLAVTHGIFSKGTEVFEDLIEKVYTANLMGQKSDMIQIV